MQDTRADGGVAAVSLNGRQDERARADFGQAHGAARCAAVGCAIGQRARKREGEGAAIAQCERAARARQGVGDVAGAREFVERQGAAIEVERAARVQQHVGGGADLRWACACNADRGPVVDLQRDHACARRQRLNAGVVRGLVEHQGARVDHGAATAVAGGTAQGERARAFLDQVAVACCAQDACAGGAEDPGECGAGVVATHDQHARAQRQGARTG